MLSIFDFNLNIAINLASSLEAIIINEEPEVANSDIKQIINQINKQFLTNFFTYFDLAFKSFQNSYSRVFMFHPQITLLCGFLLLTNLLFLAYYYFFTKKMNSKTGGFLLLFFDIPQLELQNISKKSEKFLTFCKVV